MAVPASNLTHSFIVQKLFDMKLRGYAHVPNGFNIMSYSSDNGSRPIPVITGGGEVDIGGPTDMNVLVRDATDRPFSVEQAAEL